MAHHTDNSVDLPVLEALDDLAVALARHGSAVLVAPPGTGKTTGIPPALIRHSPELVHDAQHRIVVVVPRRMAARAAAGRMATSAGESVGDRFGYSVRDDRSVSDRTVVEVVTPGLLLRRIQADPELTTTATVVLDEFHERSVDQDLLLALLLDTRAALRPDLRLLAMSATLDIRAVSELLGSSTGDRQVPVIEVESPLYPLTTHWRPGNVQHRISDRVAEVVREALNESAHDGAGGDVLVFLPGRGEISATRRALSGRMGSGTVVVELHGSLDPKAQDEILNRAPAGPRRVILSTAIAETSITVPGVRAVVDSGLRRYQEVNPSTGIPSLRTGSVSLSGAEQRSGRAAREAPGVSFRLWSKSDEELRRRHDPAEITRAELSSLLLATRSWGASSPRELSWVDPPPLPAVTRAEELLRDLGALDESGRLTSLGRSLAAFGFHPRTAAMALRAAHIGATELGAQVLAAVDQRQNTRVDLAEEVRAIDSGISRGPTRHEVRRWRRRIDSVTRTRRVLGVDATDQSNRPWDIDDMVADIALAGYADRLARRRQDRDGIYLLRHGGEVELPGAERTLGDSDWLLVIDLDARSDSVGAGRIHSAVAVNEQLLGELISRADASAEIDSTTTFAWNPHDGTTSTTRTRRLGAIMLEETRWRTITPDALTAVVTERIAAEGPSVLRGWEELSSLRSRLGYLRATGSDDSLPDLSDEAVAATADQWVPTLVALTKPGNTGRRGRSSTGELRGFDPDATSLETALLSGLTYEQRQVLDREAPRALDPPRRSQVHARLRSSRWRSGIGPVVDSPAGPARRGRASERGSRKPHNGGAVVTCEAGAATNGRSPGILAGLICAGSFRDARPLSETPLAGRTLDLRDLTLIGGSGPGHRDLPEKVPNHFRPAAWRASN